MASSKNLGLVAGISVGNTPPENTMLIWFDNNASSKKHKVYDPSQGRWVALNPSIVKNTTYTELVNSARSNGLSVGELFKITDKSNVLATAVTTTKVQYCTIKGNIVIDDLGKGKEYHITSSNLLLDDITATFNESTNQLTFLFPNGAVDINEDYILGKKRVGGKWTLFKTKFSKLISPEANNVISWRNGLFFNFIESIKSILDEPNGVVSKKSYDRDIENIRTDITNVGKNNQNIVDTANKRITDATTDEASYSKRMPLNPSLSGAPGDVKKGDTLFNVISVFQRWINKLKYATGVSLSKDYTDAKNHEYINNNDSVQSALGKIQYWLKNITSIGGLSANWRPKTENADNTDMPAAGDTLDEAFAKAVGVLNRLGVWKDGRLTYVKDGNEVSILNMLRRFIRFKPSVDNGFSEFSGDGINITDDDIDRLSYSQGITADKPNGITVNREGMIFKGKYAHFKTPISTDEYWSDGLSGAIFELADKTTAGNSSFALSAINYGTNAEDFDAGFSKILMGRMVYKMHEIRQGTYNIARNESFIICASEGEDQNVYLPESPARGTVIFITQGNNRGYHVYAVGDNRIDTKGESAKDVGINERGTCTMFIWVPGISYNNETASGIRCDGLWQCCKMASRF